MTDADFRVADNLKVMEDNSSPYDPNVESLDSFFDDGEELYTKERVVV